MSTRTAKSTRPRSIVRTANHSGGIAGLIDHTLLKADATEKQIRQLCREAVRHGFASVCVNPVWVSLAARLVRRTTVRVCTVVSFPLGAATFDAKGYETVAALSDGAAEIDMVINIGALKAGDDETVLAEISLVAEICRRSQALSKVIIECALLTQAEKVRACRLAARAGADFVKTSTGFASGGATVEDVALMSRTVRKWKLGVKAAGGIRTLADARRMVAAGATRIGTSAGVQIVQEEQSLGG